jgi:predicted transcriptional regulator
VGTPKYKRPTDAELEILNVLWDRGDATVRDVHEALSKSKSEPVGYTTTLKLMQIMLAKGLLSRNDACRPQVYTAVQTEEQTQRLIAGDLIKRAFRGSAHTLVLQALSARRATREELRSIRELLDSHERDKR